MLSLYYGIGKYVSENTRINAWGTNAVETISQQLQKELPGLRGFSAANMKKMRIFYEKWSELIKRSPSANEIQSLDNQNILPARELLLQDYSQPMGVATYSVMPEPLKKVMPDEKKLVELLGK